MKTYKYYVHGKPKIFDLTSLTPEEIEKFKAMNNTERLRFIELHHLENIPLWEQIDLKTSTKLSDEGEADRKNKQKYSELFRAKNIKNQLEQMKDKGTEPTEENIKKTFNDFETQDIKQAMKNGYADIDSLINFYANKIETLNVDSIDTLKAKEIKNLEAANIKLNDTKSLAKAIEKVFPKEYVKKIVEGIEKGDIPESVGVSVVDNDVLKTIEKLIESGNTALAADVKKYFDDLVEKVGKETGSTITKEDLNKILKTDELKEALIDEIKKAKEEIKTDIGESAEYVKKSVEDYQKIIDKLSNLQKQGVNYKTMSNSMAKMLIGICHFYGWNYKTQARNEVYEKYDKTDKIIDYPGLTTDSNNFTKSLIMLCNYNILPTGKEGSIYERALLYKNILENLYSILLNYNEFQKINNKYEMEEAKVENKEEAKEGEGLEYESSEDLEGSLEEDEGGKFLNRFKDFEPDIKRLEGMIKEIKNNQLELLKGNIKDIYSELKELKQMKEQPKIIKEEIKEESKPFKPSFLNDISKPKNLKPTETKIYKPEDLEDSEHKDLKDILRRRREDIEPDEIEDLEGSEDVDWGEGIKDKEQSSLDPIGYKVIKFKALMKMLK